jgi:hypothetical protein
VREVTCFDRLSQKSQPDGVNDLVRLLITTDLVVQHSAPGEPGETVVSEDPR